VVEGLIKSIFSIPKIKNKLDKLTKTSYFYRMLSILIPVYAEPITQLVAELVRQGRALEISFEVILLDDGSSEAIKKENQTIGEFKEVFYENLPENLGRSLIRNTLGNRAKFPYLLFLDCDSYPANEHFLKNYINHLTPNTVLVGGTAYDSKTPKGKELHWLVGSQREVYSVEERSRDPHHGFSSFNFVVPKTVFQKVKFDTAINGYGHEDTLYGWLLKKEDVDVQHVENRLIHLGLDDANTFLEKRQMAIRNLLILKEKYAMMDTRLLRTYDRITKMGVRRIVVGLYGIFEKQILQNLHSSKPRLTLFFWWSLVCLDRTKWKGK
jgi:Glycosyltransferases involved in cell wall biogenesis